MKTMMLVVSLVCLAACHPIAPGYENLEYCQPESYAPIAALFVDPSQTTCAAALSMTVLAVDTMSFAGVAGADAIHQTTLGVTLNVHRTDVAIPSNELDAMHVSVAFDRQTASLDVETGFMGLVHGLLHAHEQRLGATDEESKSHVNWILNPAFATADRQWRVIARNDPHR